MNELETTEKRSLKAMRTSFVTCDRDGSRSEIFSKSAHCQRLSYNYIGVRDKGSRGT